MRSAIESAPVGDDVLGDDPTVKALEEISAKRLGKESALFVPSGTMANLIAILSSTTPGDEVLLGDQSHIFNYEVAGASRVGGVQLHPLKNLKNGSLNFKELSLAIREKDIHAPNTSLLCLENTHNRCGGIAIPANVISDTCEIAHKKGLGVHLDGARIFNAEVFLNESAALIAQHCDSVSFCFSKGLGGPVGSVLCGSQLLIKKARRYRKMLGGGMRQVGVLAAAGIYALEHNIARLEDDHKNAKYLAMQLSNTPGLIVQIPDTNIISLSTQNDRRDFWIRELADKGVKVSPFGVDRFRMVTHLDIHSDDIEFVIKAIHSVAEKI